MRCHSAWSGAQRRIERVWLAETATERMQGLLGRPPLGENEAMLLKPCRLVHTLGMAYPLDLVFLDRHGRVRKLVQALRPARLAGCLAAQSTLELAAGRIAALGLVLGDVIELRPA
ncbi:DUF192 domain-containing protein [Chitinimonas arctica]|uniref:DUF192 domain-containing protein n=1 Tax=Chitinimonas arctica TaxID=2594795 RepID=A0A516SLI6_9NEIS|nr:DUF192 domain-containing protein [Chitinimonas arctica]QDQ29027.1 DUF192 domain-containing protein [Chitinimonas arctica]